MRQFVFAAALGILGCGSRPEGGLASTADSTGDTIMVRVRGMVPGSAVHRLVEDLRIAPGAQDTSLFTEIFEFKVDRAGRMWVFDRPTSSILLFAVDGKLIRRIGRTGSGPGEFKGLAGMAALPDSGMAIWDPQNARVVTFTAGGDLRSSATVPGGFYSTDGLALAPDGGLLIKQVVSAPRTGEILGRIGYARVRPAGGIGDSLIPPDLDVPRESYVATSKDGNSRSSTGAEFAARYQWGYHPGGYFVVANGGEYRLILARRSGKPLVVEREAPAVPVSEEERADEHARITWSMQQTQPGWSWNGPSLPEAKAPLSGLFFARDGRIWAQVGSPSERIPEAELDVPRKKDQPVRHFRSAPAYEVFTSDGELLGRVNFPARTRIMEADGSVVWALVRDTDGLPAVVRFRVTPPLP